MTFETLLEVANRFIKRLKLESSESVNNEIEIRDILQRFTTDVIFSNLLKSFMISNWFSLR